jgi:DNA-binding winged helix-turn-helix (wHTH) protein/tetratricopeptide (TPR) repeat protein
MSVETRGLFRFGPFEVDAVARAVWRQGVRLTLSRRAFDVLLYFVQNPGRVLSKDELLKSVWTDTAVDENSLLQSISVLRRALDEKPGESSYIATLQGRGYQFISRVETITTGEAPPASAALADTGGITKFVSETPTIRPRLVTEELKEHVHPRLRKRVVIGLASTLVLAGASATGYFAWRCLQPPPPLVTVVLADFENSSGDPDLDPVLNRALAIDLRQASFLNLLSKAKIQETLSQMRRSPNEALTPALAREVCERNNAQVMVHGALSKLGSGYLLLLDAEGCVSGERLTGDKAQVHSKEQLVAALDAAAGRVRRRFSESGAGREHFQVPIIAATTSSLDALRAYALAGESSERGDTKTSIRMLDQAIALDPNFAMAYKSRGSMYYNRDDWGRATVDYKKAFALREGTTQRERLTIEIAYDSGVIFDFEEAIRAMKLFSRIYPASVANWGNLCNLYTQLGEYPQAIDAGEHALRADPQSGFAAVVLARASMRANRWTEAKKAARAALAAGKELDGAHTILFQIAYGERDAAGIKSEGEWGLSHGHVSDALDDLADAGATGGKLREARDIYARASTEALRTGDADAADDILLDFAVALTALEKPAEAAAILKQTRGNAGVPDKVALLKAETGDLAPARRMAAANSAKDRDTVHNYFYVPLMRAVLALAAHRPAEAVRWLEPARPYQLCDFQVPYLRAQAETAAGMLDAAARDYRLILENQGVNPVSPLYPLAHLRLARVLARQQKPGPAGDEYKALFEAWKDADADLPLLIQARREYEALTAASPQPATTDPPFEGASTAY